MFFRQAAAGEKSDIKSRTFLNSVIPGCHGWKLRFPEMGKAEISHAVDQWGNDDIGQAVIPTSIE
jgi:hypothetical protein